MKMRGKALVTATPHSRALIAGRVAAGEPVAAVARALGISARTAHKWVRRHAEGELALEDRSCRPHRSRDARSPSLLFTEEQLMRRP
jgi:transposase-like protein